MKKLILVMLGAAVACPCRSAVICSADSPATFVDSRRGVRYEAGTNAVHTLVYDAAWVGGDATAEIAIAVDGAELARGTGVGACVWTNTTYGTHTLTYTTYLGGVAQEEVYSATFSALDVTGLGVPGLQRVTFTGSASDTRDVRLGGDPRVTLDGAGLYDSSIGEKTTFAYTGYMFFRAGETYTFRGFFDDFAWVTVDEQTVIARNASECKEGTGTISFAEAGWHAVDFRVANNGGTGGLAGGASYQGIWYKTDADTTWRPIADDGSGTLFRTGPDYCGVEILSARMRPSDPTILDIVYKVTSPLETVKVRALAYEDGKRSFATAVPVLTFADGTGANVGDAPVALLVRQRDDRTDERHGRRRAFLRRRTARRHQPALCRPLQPWRHLCAERGTGGRPSAVRAAARHARGRRLHRALHVGSRGQRGDERDLRRECLSAGGGRGRRRAVRPAGRLARRGAALPEQGQHGEPRLCADAADLGIAPRLDVLGTSATAAYATPTLRIVAFEPQTGRVRIRVAPGEGNAVRAPLATGCVHVYGTRDLSQKMRYLSGTAFDLTPYLRDATRGEADLTVALGSCTFIKVKAETTTKQEGEEE